jgi:hypothetical protein
MAVQPLRRAPPCSSAAQHGGVQMTCMGGPSRRHRCRCCWALSYSHSHSLLLVRWTACGSALRKQRGLRACDTAHLQSEAGASALGPQELLWCACTCAPLTAVTGEHYSVLHHCHGSHTAPVTAMRFWSSLLSLLFYALLHTPGATAACFASGMSSDHHVLLLLILSTCMCAVLQVSLERVSLCTSVLNCMYGYMGHPITSLTAPLQHQNSSETGQERHNMAEAGRDGWQQHS